MAKGTILIADDNPENLRVLSEMLKKEGYKVRVAKNGEQVLKSFEADLPDLLLLDVHMPGMDGFEVCRRLKDHERYRNTPVIFLSALTDTFNKVQAFEAGAVDYVTKPFHFKEVEMRVKTHLGIRRMQLELFEKTEALKRTETEIEKLKVKLKGK